MDSEASPEIQSIAGLEGIRLRPGMYVREPSDIARCPLTYLVEELVANSLYQYIQGFGRTVLVTLNVDGNCTVEDEGPGLSLDPSDIIGGLSVLEVTFSVLTEAWDRAQHSWKYGAYKGIGAIAVNAVCKRFEIDAMPWPHFGALTIGF